MSSSDAFTRSLALEKALKLYEDSPTVVSPDQVIQAAEKFRAFLSGEDAQTEPLKAKPEYVYFRYNSSVTSIYYRSRFGTDAFGPGSLERLGYSAGEYKWIPSTAGGNPTTFAEIVTRTSEYKRIQASEVPREYR